MSACTTGDDDDGAGGAEVAARSASADDSNGEGVEVGSADGERAASAADRDAGDAQRSTARFGEQDPADAPFLFASDRSQSFQIYLRSGDDIVALTDDPAIDSWSPRLSPDGATILLLRSPVEDRPPLGSADNNYQSAALWTMRLDGSGLAERIPPETYAELGPASWSPDGLQVVFAASETQIDDLRLWVADTETFAARAVGRRGGLFLDPSFGPDGRRLTYVGFPDGYRGSLSETANLEVFVANADGSDERRLTADGFEDRHPTMAPDGSAVLFETAVDPNYLFVGKWDLRLVTTTNPVVSTVLSDGTVNSAGRWHRSEAGLFFERFDFGSGGRRVAYINSDGSGLQVFGDAEADYEDITVEPIPAALGSP